ncbi:MAG: hypothetical protein AAB255_06125 [Bacteroidota bacterium]
MRIATIDLGTNTCLLLIIEINNLKSYKILREDILYPRIGKSVDDKKHIQTDAFHKTIESFNYYKSIIANYNVDKIIATGTSALRDAVNRNDFIQSVRIETGIEIKILSGEEEARLTFIGTINDFTNHDSNYTVIDIGGGSTEIIFGDNQNIIYSKSFDIGSVRMSERFLKHTPPLKSELSNLSNFISTNLKDVSPNIFRGSELIGVAGTATTLLSIHLNTHNFSSEYLNMKTISFSVLNNIFLKLASLNETEITNIPQISEGRRDIIVAGNAILLDFMEYFGWKNIKVSTRGLRFGVSFNEFENS